MCVTLSLTNGQLVLQQDAFTNSYSVATPSFQSSFTRIFGGKNQQLQAAPPAQVQPQQQQVQPQQYQMQPQQQQYYVQPQLFQQLRQPQVSTLNDQVLTIKFVFNHFSLITVHHPSTLYSIFLFGQFHFSKRRLKCSQPL